MLKTLKITLASFVLTLGFLFSNVNTVTADCNEGHYSTGNQSFGGHMEDGK